MPLGIQLVGGRSVDQLDAAVMKDGLVRADTLPLVFRLPGTESLPRGTHVRARITGCDLLTLELHASLLARLDDAPPPEAVADEAEPDAEEADAAPALTLAIDVNDADAADDPSQAPAT